MRKFGKIFFRIKLCDEVQVSLVIHCRLIMFYQTTTNTETVNNKKTVISGPFFKSNFFIKSRIRKGKTANAEC